METKKTYLTLSVTVDIVIFTIEHEKLKLLAIRRLKSPFQGEYALPGGFIKKDETSADTVKRVLSTKAGISDVYTEQLYTFDSPNRDPRGQIISVSYFALIPREQINIDTVHASESPEFIDINKLPKLGFDHNQIVEYALKRVRDKVTYTNVVFSLLPEYFTFSQLQKTYEILLNKKIDKRNFRKKIIALKLIKATNRKFKGKKQRPATLYKSTNLKIEEFEKFFASL